MGTTWNATVLGPAETIHTRIQLGIEGVLARVVGQMSPWLPGSDISRFNDAPPGTRLALPPEFLAVLRCAIEVAKLSDGAFDPTLGTVADAWGFGSRGRFDAPGFVPPRQADLQALTTGWRHIDLDTAGGLLQPGGLTLNLSAIAKGYAVDAVGDHLKSQGLANHLVEVGGELRGSGLKHGQQPWWVTIEQPAAGANLPATRIALHGLSVATSGDYRRFLEVDDERLPHTIDPLTRRPVRHGLASVTVVHDSCMWADAWATALMVMGVEAGLERAASENLAALFRWRTPSGIWREALSPLLRDMEH